MRLISAHCRQGRGGGKLRLPPYVLVSRHVLAGGRRDRPALPCIAPVRCHRITLTFGGCEQGLLRVAVSCHVIQKLCLKKSDSGPCFEANLSQLGWYVGTGSLRALRHVPYGL